MAAVAASPVKMSTSRPASASSSRQPSEGKGTEKSGAVINVVDVSEEDKKPSEDKSPQKEEGGSPKNPTRPPIRPVGHMPSKFDQEVNPFEQSFRANSHHDSTGSLSDREKSSRRNSPPRGGDETSTKHNALPPLSSLTSPAAADPSQFPWLAQQSLRTGPLSPAMLAGPQAQNGSSNRNGENGNGEHQAFDPSQFRTGFTPGTGSGFTPGYNSLMNGNGFSNLPLPSPNTAAFLNMVTNATPLGEGEQGSNEQPSGDQQQQAGQAQNHPQQGHGPPPSSLPPHMHHQQHGGSMGPYSQQGDQQDTITPGTFSALTGAINDMNRANGHHPQQPPPHGMPPQPYYNMNGPAPHHQMHGGPGGMPPQGPHSIDYAQQSANAASQAANGLFLLSQAHQELSKREEEGRGSTPLMNKRTSVGAVPPGSGKGPNASSGGQASTGGAGQKRKSDAGAAGAGGQAGGGKGKKGKKNNGAAAAAAAATAVPATLASESSPVVKKDESASPSFSMGNGNSMDGDDDGMGSSGRPETEEEKRKNFLERNRQAALKCRQRKKAWLTELQQKVDSLSTENEQLQRTIGGLHEEVGRLTALLMQRDGAMGVQPYGRPIR